jgi:MAF protein
MNIILASSSPYRKEILKKLHLPFSSLSPEINETARENESITEQVSRLAREKTLAIEAHYPCPNSYIIGSDQLACFGDIRLGKPGDFATAKKQLNMVNGQTVIFYTALCVFNTANQEIVHCVEEYQVTFKTLSSQQINTYLQIEQPYDCAGSFKSEGLGISLFASLTGRDPNSLIGLPLIALIELFNKMGVDLFTHMQGHSSS